MKPSESCLSLVCQDLHSLEGPLDHKPFMGSVPDETGLDWIAEEYGLQEALLASSKPVREVRIDGRPVFYTRGIDWSRRQ